MKFFHDCKTVSEVKAMYKKLAKENHPDLGGSTELMQQINNEYAYACVRVAKMANLTQQEMDVEMELSELYRETIEKIIHLDGIVIEVVGHWIWVTGNTRPVKEVLKEAHFYFASKKVAWYFRGDEYRSKGGKKSLDEIKTKYGCETINKRDARRLIE